LTFKPDRLTLQTVFSDGPSERAGLSPDDELVAADALRLTPDNTALRLEQLPPGTAVRLSYFRRDELRQTVLTVAERPADTYWLERLENPTDAQKTAFQAWAGAAMP
jgi:predicted metalloprotease with PDZ domain